MRGEQLLRSLVVVLGFAVALGATTLIFPLLAVEAGFSVSLVGLFTSVSAVVQLGTRFGLPWMLSRFSDRSLVMVAALLIVGSAIVLLASLTLASFLLAQALQGASRAFFWTASQSYAVRDDARPLRRLAQIQMTSKVGAILGPALAGGVATYSLRMALWVIVSGGLLASPSALLMAKRKPLPRAPRGQRRGMWRRPGMAVGYWTSLVAGGWRGILDSYVPVVLAAGGLGTAAVGGLLSLAEMAAFASSAWLATVNVARPLGLVRGAALGVLGAVAVLPFVAAVPWIAASALAVAGFGGGLATALGPGLANDHAREGEQGTALAAAGAYRSAARMVSPSAVGAVGSLMGVSAAMGVVAFGLCTPVLALLGWQHLRSRTGETS